MPAPTFVNAATVIESTNATAHPITVPAGVQVGDLLLLSCDSATSIGITHTPPAGWTAIDANHAMGGSSSPKMSLWCKIATASEVAGQVVSVGSGGSTTLGLAIAAWRNIDPASLPLGWAVTNTGTTQVTSWTVDASAINITKTMTLAVFISTEDTSAGAAHDTTPPSGFTEVVDTLPGVGKGFEIAWRTIDATNLGVLSASVSPAGRSMTWVVAFNGADGVIPSTAGQLWPHGKKGTSPTTGQLFPRRVIT